MRLAHGVAVVVLGTVWACTTTPEDLQSFHPLLVADQTAVRFPDSNIGELVEAQASFSNPGSGVTRFSARLEPATTTITLAQTQLAASPGSPGVVRLRYLALAAGTVGATLVVEHDGEAGADGTRVVRTPVQALTRAPPDCDDHNVCTLDQVDATVPGGCVHLPMDGLCDDGNACTTADRCEAGMCLGTAVQCDDGVACTANRCDPQQGCVFEPRAAACDDGDPCTVDSCAAGVPGLDGCSHSLAPTGTLCGPPSCGTVSMCVVGVCSAMPTPDGFPCDDGNPCTRGDTCAAGLCVPGEGGGTALQPPVLLREITTTQGECENALCGVPSVDGGSPPRAIPSERPIAGHWPVAVDGLTPLITDALPPAFLMVWRGGIGPLGAQCYYNPQYCQALPSCNAGPGTSTDLMLSTVGPEGTIYSTLQFPVDEVYQRVMQQAGAGWAFSAAPASTVLAVKVVEANNRMLGAALLSFADSCSNTCPPNAGSGGGGGGVGLMDGGVGASPPPPCIPQGKALVVFEAYAGAFAIRHTRWLDRQSVYSAEMPPLLPLLDGTPLLAVATAGSQLGVSWATVLDSCPPNADCAANSESMVVHLLMLGTDAATDLDPSVPLETSLQHDIPWPGERDNLADVSLHGPDWRLIWSQRATTLPPENRVGCLAEEWREVWTLWFSGDDLYANPSPLVMGVNGYAAAGQGGFRRTRRGIVQPTNACSVEETFQYEDGTRAQFEPVIFAQPDHPPLGPATALLWNGTPVVLGPTEAGSWALAWPGQEPLETQLPEEQTTPWPGAGMARNTPVRVTTQSPALVMAGVAELGIFRDSLPTPALAISQMGCAPSLVLEP